MKQQRWVLGLIALLLMTLQVAAWAAEPSVIIELRDVPSTISLPLPEGTNRYINAELRGMAQVTAVWVGHSSDSKDKLVLAGNGMGRYQLNLADSKLLALVRSAPSHEFRVFVQTSDGQVLSSAAVRCTVVPAPQLQLPPDGAKVVVTQNSSVPVPGSDGSVMVAITSVSSGQVLASVKSADGASIVEPISVKEGANVPLEIDGRKYVLQVVGLHNRVIADDWAEFKVVAAQASGSTASATTKPDGTMQTR
jgi:hypothetical protein